MAGFDEVQFPTDISYGSRGGPGFMTSIVVLDSGHESRNINWTKARAKYNVAYGIRDMAQLLVVQAFFMARYGKAYGFRYKDWLDYQVTNEPLVVTGSKFVQLIKSYTSGPRTYVRTISKPIAGVTMRRAGSPFSSFTLDTTTGIATLTADSSATISAITKANPGVVTTVSPHGFSNGDKIYIENALGMTQVNGVVFTIAGASGSTFDLGLDTTNYGTYTGGASARKFVQPAEALDWTGQFDVPVRFDADEIPTSLDEFSLGSLDINLLEVRI
jgi:uncharacterized protein (TIGR02217 family)